jgi:murein DD-endopeptidase MepM/ murein hydrolase activator NlpD
MWKILAIVIALAVGAGAVWVMAGREPGPVIEIREPSAVGQTGTLVLAVEAPHGTLDSLDVVLEQDGATTPLFSLAAGDGTALEHETEDRVRLTRPLGKRDVPSLTAGAAKVTVTAVRPVLFGYRQATSTASRDFDVRLTPPQLAALSQFHYINHGGSEVIVYRVSPATAQSGVRVGDVEYPGFPASGAGIANADPAVHVAFFALLWDQDVATPIALYARDELGNEATGTFDYRVFQKTFRQSRIEVDDQILARVVPAILQNSPELKVADPSNLLNSWLTINGELRRRNAETIASLAAQTSPEILWHGAFKQLINTAVEAGFADQRTYVYKGQEVDHQVHLGFDLASTLAAPVHAANRGRVVHAGWLGIYGNCVILDHGMGLQSLYAHLSQIEVAPGDMVEIDQEIGRSGATGLAGGDHLHFTMLLGGHAVTPIDWWSAQWIQDRVMRKLVEAGAPATAATQ